MFEQTRLSAPKLVVAQLAPLAQGLAAAEQTQRNRDVFRSCCLLGARPQSLRSAAIGSSSAAWRAG
jgi:hypothetical protein